jgi:hypothetical protein
MRNKNGFPESLEGKELKNLINTVREKGEHDIWFEGSSSGKNTQKVEDLAIIEMALITYKSQENLNKLTKYLVILTITLVYFTFKLIQ